MLLGDSSRRRCLVITLVATFHSSADVSAQFLHDDIFATEARSSLSLPLQVGLTMTHSSQMDQDPEAQIVYFDYGQKFIEVRRLLDGASVARMDLAHELHSGKSKDSMIVTAGFRPNSVIFINDRHRPAQQQRIEMGEDRPLRIAISPTQHLVAVLTQGGLGHCGEFIFSVRAGRVFYFSMDAATKFWSRLRVLDAHTQCGKFSNCSVQFDPTGQRLATAMCGDTADSAWKVWDVATGWSARGYLIPLFLHIADQLIRVFNARNHYANMVIFSHTDPNVLFAESKYSTVRLSLVDGSVTEFNGHPGQSCWGDAMSLNTDGTVLYVAYDGAKCVIAWNVATQQPIWKVNTADGANSVLYHDGVVLVGVHASEFKVLSAADGRVVRTLIKAGSDVSAISVLPSKFILHVL